MASSTATSALADLLVARGLVEPADMYRVRGQVSGTLALMDRLVALGLVAEEQIARALADDIGCPYVTVALSQVDPELVRRVSFDRLEPMRALPLIDDGSGVDVAFADPTDPRALASLAAALNRPVRPAVATSTAIRAALREVFGSGSANAVEPVDEASGTLRLYGHLLSCVNDGSSDLLVSPVRDGGAVRLRRDGRIREVDRLRSSEHAALLARLRSLVGVAADAGGRRSATLRSDVAGKALWITIALVPTTAGEAARVHLEPVIAVGEPYPGGIGRDLAQRLGTFLASGEGLMVVNDLLPERAAAVVDGLLREAGSSEDQRIAVGREPAPSVESAITLEAESFGGDLAVAVRAALALDPDVLVVRPSPGEPPPREALVSLRPGRRLVLLGAWRDAADTLLGLREAGLPAGVAEASLRWIVTLAAAGADENAAVVELDAPDVRALAQATADALRGRAVEGA